ncbi:MAG: sulfatase-like hydrolase/transferase [Chthoniobacter sp.]|uniref:sulfatase-like hydrolase/transferase n=1 Tax=Chthoniobacter sp. TaxID=2510640 RepID=UPI0032A29814
MKNRIPLFVLAALLLLFPGAGRAAETPAPSKPNIIYILADDLGIGAVSCYGADHFRTPQIDALAQSGTRFTHCYACPLCGPTRALLMTGRYAFHTGMTGNDSGPLLKPANETMMPRVLKPAGYATAMVGKWSQLPLQPADWGFDEYLRFQGSGKYWNTQHGAETYTLNGKETPLHDGEYLPDRMQTFAIDFIQRHQDKPFYLYYAMSHVHAEILRTPDSAPDSKDFYADNVTYMDKLVGRLVAELDRLHLREKTLIVFSGDNGTAPAYAARATVNGKALSGHKGTMLECGALVPCFATWPGRVPQGRVAESLIDLSDFFPTLAEIAGATLPAGLTIDGKDFAPQLLGKSDNWPRSWIFVELGTHWYDRDPAWKLNEAAELYDMRGAPFEEKLVASSVGDDAAVAARARLQAVLDQLNPGGGKVDPGDGSGKHANKAEKKAKKKGTAPAAAPATNSQNANPPDQ